MRKMIFSLLLAFLPLLVAPALAQPNVWIQIEAQPSLGKAQERARIYSGRLDHVNGFSLSSGWYAIALGPFTRPDAQEALIQLRATGQIPADSYIVDGGQFRRQFWPVGAAVRPRPGPVAPSLLRPDEATVPSAPAPDSETPEQARRSERQLSPEERRLIQTALKWEGFYTAAIDGAFGRGTRAAMAQWQRREGLEPTGVLTTAQRSELLKRYREAMDSLGLAPYTDMTAGIEIDLPMAMVEFERYDPPFARFRAKDGSGVRVMLISQTGDAATLRGLYDIMQTLKIVPLDGARRFEGRSFTLIGEDDEIYSYTHAALKDGQVKGFTLVWPAGPDRRRDLVIERMRASFRPRAEAVLPDAMGDAGTAQSPDLLAGLEIRRPELARSGFFIDPAGSVLTALGGLEQCERITLDEEHPARLAASDPETGLALLKPQTPLVPLDFARLREGAVRLNSEIAVAGYSYGGALGAPTLTFGTLSDLRGLNGEPGRARLALEATEGDSGGPVFDATGAVMGVLLPDGAPPGRKLPEGVAFATGAAEIARFLEGNGIEPLRADGGGRMAPEDLTILAADMTVLVSCWN